MAFDSNDNLIVADAIQGLISIDDSGEVTSLSIKSDSDNIPFKFVDDLDIASDGKIYFSDASSKYGYGNDRLELLEHSANGDYWFMIQLPRKQLPSKRPILCKWSSA